MSDQRWKRLQAGTLVVKWWIEPAPGRDAHALYVVRYRFPEGNGVPISEFRTDGGWIKYGPHEHIEPLFTFFGVEHKMTDRETLAEAMAAMVDQALLESSAGVTGPPEPAAEPYWCRDGGSHCPPGE